MFRAMSKNQTRKATRRLYTENKHLRRELAWAKDYNVRRLTQWEAPVTKTDWADIGLLLVLFALIAGFIVRC